MKVIQDIDIILQSIIGEQVITDTNYHVSQYVIRLENDKGILLYHTFTCELICMQHEEYDTPVCQKELIRKWFLVPETMDEYQFVSKNKRIRQLWYKAEARKKYNNGIDRFWILTTTYCNARCFYCHENGIPQSHMSFHTANSVIKYIKKVGTNRIHIFWYGGEPMMNVPIINHISSELNRNNIIFTSSMISNGFLFDSDLAHKAYELWNLKQIQITLDGMELTYNKVKSYIGHPDDNPFQIVINNIKFLLDMSISVKVRLNLDLYNMTELSELTDWLYTRFKQYKNFTVYSAPLLENCLGTDLIRNSEERKKVFDAHIALSEKLKNIGIIHKTELPKSIRSEVRCIALSNARVIFPDGQLAFCHDYSEGILSGYINETEPSFEERLKYSKCLSEKLECQTCLKYPQCVRLEKCFINECNIEILREWIYNIKNEMIWKYEEYAK